MFELFVISVSILFGFIFWRIYKWHDTAIECYAKAQTILDYFESILSPWGKAQEEGESITECLAKYSIEKYGDQVEPLIKGFKENKYKAELLLDEYSYSFLESIDLIIADYFKKVRDCRFSTDNETRRQSMDFLWGIEQESKDRIKALRSEASNHFKKVANGTIGTIDTYLWCNYKWYSKLFRKSVVDFKDYFETNMP